MLEVAIRLFVQHRIHRPIARQLEAATEDERLKARVARTSRLGDEHTVKETAQLSVQQAGILSPEHLREECAAIL